MKLLIICTILLFLSGCRNFQELNKPKPVEINGLGSLQSLKDKQFDEAQLRTLFDGLNDQKQVNETDAEALLSIYKNNSKEFIKFSGRASESGKVVNYLSLILQEERLREDVKQTTDAAMVEQIRRLVTFTDSGGGISALSGDYLAAAIKVIGKDDKEVENDLLGKQRTANAVVIIQGFEAKAVEITADQKSTVEAKQNAEKFLSDLKLYNESLPANAKILDSNGRLINPSQMTGFQKQSLEDIFSGRENPGQSGLYDRTEGVRDKLRLETNLKLH